MAKRRFQIDQLIINSPYEEPSSYWSYDREVRMFERKDGRRPAGYVVAVARTVTHVVGLGALGVNSCATHGMDKPSLPACPRA
jgi:hypothetical protein